MSDNSEKSGCPVWMKALLVLSLVINVAVIGMFAGHVLMGPSKGGGANRQVEWILQFVPDGRYDEVKTYYDDKRDDMRTLQRRRIGHLEEIIVAIKAEPFSPETLEAAIRARAETSAERRAIVEDGLVVIMGKFTADERADFAAKIEARLDDLRRRRLGN